MVPWRTFNINGIFSLHKMYFIVEKGSMFMVLLRTVWGTVFWGTHKGSCMASWWKPPIFFLLFFLKIYFWRFCLLFDRTVDRQETKLEREGGRDRERSTSRDSNTGRPKRNGTTCRRAAHKAISADENPLLKLLFFRYKATHQNFEWFTKHCYVVAIVFLGGFLGVLVGF